MVLIFSLLPVCLWDVQLTDVLYLKAAPTRLVMDVSMSTDFHDQSSLANTSTPLLFLFQISCFSGSIFSQYPSTHKIKKDPCSSLRWSLMPCQHHLHFSLLSFFFLNQSKLFHGLCRFFCLHTQLSSFICYSMMVFAPTCSMHGPALACILCVWVYEWSCVPPQQQQTVVTSQDAWRES